MIFRKPFLIILFFIFSSALHAQLTYNSLIVQYDSAWSFKNLKLIPVKFKSSGAGSLPGFDNSTISFEDALRSGKITVHEITAPAGSDIGVLEIKNMSKKNVLVNSGDIVIGGKQDRAAAETILIPPTEDRHFLNVYCVEKQRWDEKSKPFSYGGMADAGLRREIDVQQKQNKVWKEIDSQFTEKNVKSDTWKYMSLYKDSSHADTAYMNFFKNKIAHSDSSFAGFVAVSGTRIINCELFGSTQFCLLSYENLVKSYVHSIAETEDLPAVSDNEVRNFLDKFLKSEQEQQRYVALHGRIYKTGTAVIHLVVYGD
jgi:hypothetical protein